MNADSTNGSVSQDRFDQITRSINGGFNGKESRDELFERARGALA